VRRQEVQYFIRALAEDPSLNLEEIYKDKIDVPSKKLFVTPKTKGQKEYVDAIRDYDIVVGIGPAGTGKTYLAMAMAVSALRRNEVSRIILTRPAVEAGESLGYLPGDLYDKVSPYLRPLYDALYEMMDADKIHKFLESGVIEVAPLAYMRGRTLNDSFIIMDEAQNATPEQMKMFLTRLGFDSKTVITGDITQSDLPGGKAAGLIQAMELLKHIEGIKVIRLSGHDVVRHELVQRIIKAYEEMDSKR
jgi:phosphate starvation-inducible PhoH-like protein